MEKIDSHKQIVSLLHNPGQNEWCRMEPQDVDVKFYLRKRYLVTIFVFLGWITLFMMRMNLTICIVEMTSNKTINIGNETLIIEAEYDWSSKEKGFILSVFSWGYMGAPLGALVARKIGAIETFGTGIALTATLTIASPILIKWDVMVYAVARICEGIFEGFTASTAVEVLRQWSTPAERARIIGGTSSGYMVGTMLGFPVCGTIAYYLDWKAVFYITGGISLMWCFFWFSLIKNNPEADNLMSVQEKNYMMQENKFSPKEKVDYPWIKIFTSKPVWAFWNDRFVEAWSNAFLSYCLPIYIKDVHNINIQEIGFLSAIPHVCGIGGILGGAVLADYLRNNSVLSISNTHKLYLSFAQFAAMVLLVTAALWKNFVVNMICFSLFRLLFALCIVSYQLIPVDIGGKCSCLISGIGYTFIGLGYTMATVLMGYIVTDHSVAQWSLYFLVLSIFNLWGAIIFFKFGSGKMQPWAIEGHENTK